MPSEFAFDVFLSHSSEDKPRVRRLAERLRAAALRVWFDEWVIAPGDDIYLAIERGLEAARTLVLFLSPAALGSDWIGLERSTVLFRDPSNTGRRFLPVLLEDCDLPNALRRFQYVDLREENDETFAQLLAACKGEARPAPRPAKRKRPPSSARTPAALHNLTHFALLSLGSFLAGALLLWLLVAKAELLVRLGLEGKLYYLVLLPLGLAVAGFLFGALRSFAFYRGKALGGVLELGGPVVVFGLVILGGFLLVPSREAFSVTVFVHGEGGVQDVPLRGQGSVVLDLGPDRRREAIGDKGEAHFSGIPSNFRGQEAPVGLEAEGFEPVRPDAMQRLGEASLYLAVKRWSVTLRGRVQDPEGRPVAGAILRLRELSKTSDSDGSFTFEIPGSLLQEDLSLSVSAPGYEPWHEAVVPGSNDVVVPLRRALS